MPTNVQPAEFSPHNVLGMSHKAVYLTDPMNKLPETSDELNPDDGAETPPDNLRQNPDTNSTEHDWKKRYSDLRSYTDKKMATLEDKVDALTTQLETKPTQVQDTPSMPKTPQEFKEFKEKYPELAAMIETAVMLNQETVQAKLSQRLKQVEDTAARVNSDKGLEELKKYHPDVLEIKDDPRFHAWFNEQLPEVQNLLRSPNPKTIAKGLDMYKVETGIAKTPKQKADEVRNASRAIKANPNTRVEINDGSPRIYKESEIDKLSNSEFEKLQDDIKAALYQGRVLIGQ